MSLYYSSILTVSAFDGAGEINSDLLCLCMAIWFQHDRYWPSIQRSNRLKPGFCYSIHNDLEDPLLALVSTVLLPPNFLITLSWYHRHPTRLLTQTTNGRHLVFGNYDIFTCPYKVDADYTISINSLLYLYTEWELRSSLKPRPAIVNF